MARESNQSEALLLHDCGQVVDLGDKFVQGIGERGLLGGRVFLQNAQELHQGESCEKASVPQGNDRKDSVSLTEADEAKLKEGFSSDTWPFVEFAIHTRLRDSEQFNLKWENIDLTSKVLTIPLSKSGEARHIRLNGKAVSVLIELKGRQVILTPWAFPSPVNQTKPRDGNAFYKKIFIPAVQKSDLSGVVWNTLRHTFCSRLVQQGSR